MACGRVEEDTTPFQQRWKEVPYCRKEAADQREAEDTNRVVPGGVAVVAVSEDNAQSRAPSPRPMCRTINRNSHKRRTLLIE